MEIPKEQYIKQLIEAIKFTPKDVQIVDENTINIRHEGEEIIHSSRLLRFDSSIVFGFSILQNYMFVTIITDNKLI
jgi:hypothetical protein